MRSSSHQRRRSRGHPRSRSARFGPAPKPWPLIFWCSILYAMVGAILAAFPLPAWIWILAVVGAIIQIIALAGPQALRRFRWLAANLLVLGSSLGAGLLAIALAVALNHNGTDQLDELTMNSAFWEVFRYSAFAMVLAAISSGVTAALGDRLLRHFQQRQTMAILMATALIGLGVGSMFGYLTRQG